MLLCRLLAAHSWKGLKETGKQIICPTPLLNRDRKKNDKKMGEATWASTQVTS